MRVFLLLIAIFFIGFTACENKNDSASGNPATGTPDPGEPEPNKPEPNKPDPGKPEPNDPDLEQFTYNAVFVEEAPVIDGTGDDAAWKKAEWKPIDQVWMTPVYNSFTPPADTNFSGRFKIVWTEDRLYYLVEITDNIIVHGRDPYVNPENDDCLELFINSNGKGGNHVANNTAIAYHMKLDEENAMDYVSGHGFIKRNHHLVYKIGNLDLPNRGSIDGSNKYVWEVEMKIYSDTLPVDDNPETTPPAAPEKLSENKTMRFAVAYCDADETGSREYFMGNVFIPGSTADQKNKAYQTADVFAKLNLVK